MNGITISLLHATRWRPEKAIACMRLWMERAEKPQDIEYIFAFERDDVASDVAIEKALDNPDGITFGQVSAIRGNFGGSAPAWNAAYKASSGSLLIQVSDDQEPPHHYDAAILTRLPTDWQEKPLVVAVGDSNRNDSLLTTLVATRKFCDEEGCFLFPGYKSVWSDGDATYRAYKRNAVVEARDLVFEHKHPFFNKSVPMDDTYKLQNEPIRYAEGEAIFNGRHPDWRSTGIVDWL